MRFFLQTTNAEPHPLKKFNPFFLSFFTIITFFHIQLSSAQTNPGYQVLPSTIILPPTFNLTLDLSNFFAGDSVVYYVYKQEISLINKIDSTSIPETIYLFQFPEVSQGAWNTSLPALFATARARIYYSYLDNETTLPKLSKNNSFSLDLDSSFTCYSMIAISSTEVLVDCFNGQSFLFYYQIDIANLTILATPIWETPTLKLSVYIVGEQRFLYRLGINYDFQVLNISNMTAISLFYSSAANETILDSTTFFQDLYYIVQTHTGTEVRRVSINFENVEETKVFKFKIPLEDIKIARPLRVYYDIQSSLSSLMAIVYCEDSTGTNTPIYFINWNSQENPYITYIYNSPWKVSNFGITNDFLIVADTTLMVHPMLRKQPYGLYSSKVQKIATVSPLFAVEYSQNLLYMVGSGGKQELYQLTRPFYTIPANNTKSKIDFDFMILSASEMQFSRTIELLTSESVIGYLYKKRTDILLPRLNGEINELTQITSTPFNITNSQDYLHKFHLNWTVTLDPIELEADDYLFFTMMTRTNTSFFLITQNMNFTTNVTVCSIINRIKQACQSLGVIQVPSAILNATFQIDYYSSYRILAFQLVGSIIFYNESNLTHIHSHNYVCNLQGTPIREPFILCWTSQKFLFFNVSDLRRCPKFIDIDQNSINEIGAVITSGETPDLIFFKESGVSTQIITLEVGIFPFKFNFFTTPILTPFESFTISENKLITLSTDCQTIFLLDLSNVQQIAIYQSSSTIGLKNIYGGGSRIVCSTPLEGNMIDCFNTRLPGFYMPYVSIETNLTNTYAQMMSFLDFDILFFNSSNILELTMIYPQQSLEFKIKNPDMGSGEVQTTYTLNLSFSQNVSMNTSISIYNSYESIFNTETSSLVFDLSESDSIYINVTNSYSGLWSGEIKTRTEFLSDSIVAYQPTTYSYNSAILQSDDELVSLLISNNANYFIVQNNKTFSQIAVNYYENDNMTTYTSSAIEMPENDTDWDCKFFNNYTVTSMLCFSYKTKAYYLISPSAPTVFIRATDIKTAASCSGFVIILGTKNAQNFLFAIDGNLQIEIALDSMGNFNLTDMECVSSETFTYVTFLDSDGFMITTALNSNNTLTILEIIQLNELLSNESSPSWIGMKIVSGFPYYYSLLVPEYGNMYIMDGKSILGNLVTCGGCRCLPKTVQVPQGDIGLMSIVAISQEGSPIMLFYSTNFLIGTNMPLMALEVHELQTRASYDASCEYPVIVGTDNETIFSFASLTELSDNMEIQFEEESSAVESAYVEARAWGIQGISNVSYLVNKNPRRKIFFRFGFSFAASFVILLAGAGVCLMYKLDGKKRIEDEVRIDDPDVRL